MARIDQIKASRASRYNRYFSESFKKSKVREIEKNLVSIAQLSREYEVSRTAIYKWIYKYSRNLRRETKQVIELKSDTKKIEALTKKIKELERIVGQKQIQIDFNKKMIELAEEEYNVDIKKKYGSKPSSNFGQEENTDTK
jgi:transposase-like protein